MKLYKLMRKPPFFMRPSHYMKKDDNPVKSGKKSRKAVILPLVLFQYGSMIEKLKASGKESQTAITASIKEMIKSAKNIRNNPKLGKTKIDADTLSKLEKYAKELGISQIGYTKVNPDYIYQGFEILYENAMILTMDMKKDAMKSAPSAYATSEIWRTYSSLGEIVNKLADFLREKGYDCQASPAVGGDMCTPPVAQDAGIGVIGKNGLLITPEFGPSQRIAAIFINADNLPLAKPENNPHHWIRDFCDTCNNCVRKCPGQAILKETKVLKDGYPQYIEREKCAPPFSKNCCTCIASCPFINGNYEQIKKNFLKQ